MILFTDNDIILKLAAFDLLDATVEILQGEEICVLDSAQHRMRRLLHKSKNKKPTPHDEPAIERALQFCERATALPSAPNEIDGDALEGAEYEDEDGKTCRVDGGELILFSEAFRTDESFLVTGDKNSIYAFGRHASDAPLAQRPHVQTMRDSLEKRVVCLEATILALCTHVGFAEVRACVVPQRACDQTLRVVFGSGLQSTPENVEQALQTYLKHAERSVGEDWLWRASN